MAIDPESGWLASDSRKATEDAELDSPPFTPLAVAELAARGYRRENSPRTPIAASLRNEP